MGANPPGLDREPRRDIYFFIHNVYANFFKDSLDYFSQHLYPRFEHKVVGTYDKSVEYIKNVCQYGRETDKPMLPAIILNPSGDFDLADGSAGGKQLWRFPNLAPGMIKRIFEPVYQDEHTQVTVGFIRIQGDIELLLLLNSFYEYCDLRMLLLEIFAGYERWIYPQFFTTFIILPEELVNYEYTNEYTGLKYKLDWESAGAYDKLVKTTARNELVIPCNIKPIYKLTGFSDASTRYGGADALADWRLGVTIRYEIEIPAFLVLQSDYLVENVDVRVNAGSAYSNYTSYDIPTFKLMKESNYDWGLDSTSNSIIQDVTYSSKEEEEYSFNTRYFHPVSQAQADSTSNIVIHMPEQITNLEKLLLNSKYGKMEYGDHYILKDNGNNLEIKVNNVELEKDMVIEMYVYKKTV